MEAKDTTETPSFIIPKGEGFKMYPMNIEFVDAYLETKVDKIMDERQPYKFRSGAV